MKTCPMCNKDELKPYGDSYCCYGCGAIMLKKDAENPGEYGLCEDCCVPLTEDPEYYDAYELYDYQVEIYYCTNCEHKTEVEL